jgi:hypothetical protein
MYNPAYVPHVMSTQAHPTVEPEQTKTDTFAVFSDNAMADEMALIRRVEVPRYSVPTSDGVELSFGKRLSLAVAFAIEAEDTSPPPELVAGNEYMVMHDIEDAMEFTQYEQNPAFDATWNPNEETAKEFVEQHD